MEQTEITKQTKKGICHFVCFVISVCSVVSFLPGLPVQSAYQNNTD